MDVPSNPLEKDYYPPWNKLLNYLFPPNSNFTVCPQSWPTRETKAIDFYVDFRPSFLLEIMVKRVVVMVVELKNGASELNSLSARREADTQIRTRLVDLAGMGNFPLQKLYGISAFGTHMRLYTATKAQGVINLSPPPNEPPEGTSVHAVWDVAPQEGWSDDIMTRAGADKLSLIVAEVKGLCVGL
jgi:hypothetical protein